MPNQTFFPQAHSTPTGIPITDIINADQDYKIRHLINRFALETGDEGKGSLIDLQVSLDRLALEIHNHSQQFAADSAINLGYPSVEAAHNGLLAWADGTVDKKRRAFEDSMDKFFKTLSIPRPPIPEKSAAEKEVLQQLTESIRQGAKAYQESCKKLSNVQLASALINDALELIDHRVKMRTSAQA